MPGYSRTNFVNAVLTNLYDATANFPGKFVQVGFWTVQDANTSQPLWEEIRERNEVVAITLLCALLAPGVPGVARAAQPATPGMNASTVG